jgi:integrase
MLKRRLSKMDPPSPGNLIFPAKGTTDKVRRMISNAFPRTVEALQELPLEAGGIRQRHDKREKITFHSLRHTYASWLVMKDVSLYVVKELLGHSTIKMTERYSHLTPDHRHAAILKVFG